MERLKRRTTGLALVIFCCFATPAAPDDKKANPTTHYWPQWRGPLSTGVAPDADPPLEWSEIKNVRWKVALPGKGHSTPIVWGNRVFLTTAVPDGDPVSPKPETAPGAHDNVLVTHYHKFLVIAVNRDDGKIAWQRTVHRLLPHEGGHYTSSYASASPVTDGERLIAFFGSAGIFCLDLSGEIKWQKDLGDMQTKHGHGEGSSPALHGDTLIVNWDHEGQSFITAFDKRTGAERWNVKRDEVTSWATPLAIEHSGKPQVIVSGTDRLRSYDLATGKVIWECGGLAHNIVASPVAADGMVFAASSYVRRAMIAVRLEGASGDVTGTDKLAWTRLRGTPYVPSPLLYDQSIYMLRHYQGILSRIHTKTGDEQNRPLRLDHIIRNVYASPVGAAGRVYITDLDGTTVVLSHDNNPKVLAENRLRDSFSASAAVVGRELYLRGLRRLYCIANDKR